MKVSGRGTCTLLPSSTHIQGWFPTACGGHRQQRNNPLLPYRPETRREETSTGQPSTLGKDHVYTNHILTSFSYIMLVLKLSRYPEASDASTQLSCWKAVLSSLNRWNLNHDYSLPWIVGMESILFFTSSFKIVLNPNPSLTYLQLRPSVWPHLLI